jgi:hypothetical protein
MHQLDVVWLYSAAVGPARDGLFVDLPGPVGTAVDGDPFSSPIVERLEKRMVCRQLLRLH